MLYLSQEEARAHLFAKQGLSTPLDSPLDVFDSLCAIQTQYAASLPTTLALRLDKLKPTWHTKQEHQTVLKSWTLRHTLHAHTAEDHATILGAIGDQFFKRFCFWMQSELGDTEEQVRQRCAEVEATLSDGPLTRPELHERMPSLKQIPMAGWGADIKGLAYLGRLKILVSEGGQTRFATHQPPEIPSREEALRRLMRRYFAAFGPATLNDFRHWVGLRLFDVTDTFQEIREEFQEVEVEGMKGKRYVYGDIQQSKIPRVKLLAKFDPLTLGHSDKTLLLSEENRTKVFRIAAQVEAGVLVDGKFVGTWRLNRKGKGAEVVIEPFKSIAKARLPALTREAKRAAKSLGLELNEIRIT